MKKVRQFLITLNIIVASFGVYATALTNAATIYYVDEVGFLGHCDKTVTSYCIPGNGEQCMNGFYYVYKRVDGGVCEPFFRL
jgi:hypothetical protein